MYNPFSSSLTLLNSLFLQCKDLKY